MKLFLDDCRVPPNDMWMIARSYDVAVTLFEHYGESIRAMSLDHDLGTEKTGYDFLLYVVEKYYPALAPFQCIVHSANPVGQDRMLGVIERYFVHQGG